MVQNWFFLLIMNDMSEFYIDTKQNIFKMTFTLL